MTREGLDARHRSVWLEIAGAGGLLATLHGPRPPGPWEPFPWPGFGPFPRPGFTPPPEPGPRLPEFTPPPEPRLLPGLPPLLGIPPLPPGFRAGEGETTGGEDEEDAKPNVDDPSDPLA